MTREENLAYRRECPYDAMGDYSAFFAEEKQESGSGKNEVSQPDIPTEQIK